MDFEPNDQLIQQVELKLHALGRIETARPLELSPEEVLAMRSVFTEAGLNMEPGDEAIRSLQESQFRADLTVGRGPGMVAVMGDPAQVAYFREQCRVLATTREWDYLIGENPDSEGRGLMQTGVDFVTICVVNDPSVTDKLSARMSRRAWKGLLKAREYDPEAVALIQENFSGLERPVIKSKEYRNLSSVPPNGVAISYKAVRENSRRYN